MERDTGSNYAERVCVWDPADDKGDPSINDELIRAQQRASQHEGPSSGSGR